MRRSSPKPADRRASRSPSGESGAAASGARLRVAPARATVAACLVAAMALAVYANTLGNGFVDDDEGLVLRNPWIRDVRSIPEIFSRDNWSFLGKSFVSNYYRPLVHVIYLVNYHLFGLRAWGFHLANVAVHAAVSVLVYFLAARIVCGEGSCASRGRDRLASALGSVPFVAALLFATHPVHTEAVAWIAAMSEISFSLFYLLSLYLYVTGDSPFGKRNALSLVAFGLALLCKETALTLPVLLVLHDASLGERKGSAADYLGRYLPYVAVGAGYLALRYEVFQHALVPVTTVQGLSLSESIINVFPLVTLYAGMLLWPVELNFWHSFHPIASLLTGAGVLSLLLVATFVAAGLVAWKRHRPGFFCLCLIAVPLAPAFLINLLPGKPFAERYAYLPSVGFVLLLALFLCRTVSALGTRMLSILAIVLILGLYSIRTVSRNTVWKDAETLFSDTVRRSPDAMTPRYDLGVILFKLGRADEAIPHYRVVVERQPDHAGYQSALGSALLADGRLEEAVEHLKNALRLDPASLESYNDLAIALRRRGDMDGAVVEYRRALAIDPGFADAHFNLGGVLAETGRMDEAIEHYRAAVRLRPESAYYRAVLGIECGKMGLLDEAVEQFREAVRLDPADPAHRSNLDRALALKRTAEPARDGSK